MITYAHNSVVFIAKYVKGCPRLLRTDLGSENSRSPSYNLCYVTTTLTA